MGSLCSKQPIDLLDVKPNPTSVMQLRHFKYIATLGKGAYARIILAKRKQTGKIFAIKIYKKSDFENEERFAKIKNEKNLLTSFSSPYVIKVFNIFESQNKICFVLEFMIGGSLGYHLFYRGNFNKNAVLFYASEILEALHEVHSHGFIYRDLKPDNILLDKEGHIKLSDFNLSVSLNTSIKDSAGTTEYAAPETILQDEQGAEIDYWAYGVILYEMIEGRTPFLGKTMMETLDNIIECKLRFTDNFTPESIDLISMLLKKYPDDRLKDIDSIKSHKFFERVCWSQVKDKRKASPLGLSVSSELDLKYFQKKKYSKFSIEDKNEDIPLSDISYNSDLDP